MLARIRIDKNHMVYINEDHVAHVGEGQHDGYCVVTFGDGHSLQLDVAASVVHQAFRDERTGSHQNIMLMNTTDSPLVVEKV